VGPVQALDVLSKTESSEIFQKAREASLKRTGQSLRTAVANPVETLKGMPAGVGRFFDRVWRDVTTGMQKVGDTKQAGQSGSDTSEAVQEGAATAGESVIGHDDARRRWPSTSAWTRIPPTRCRVGVWAASSALTW
jgi:hypothetical protein